MGKKEIPLMEKPKIFKSKVLQYIGGILNMFYSYLFVEHFLTDATKHSPFLFLIVFLLNIFWMFFYYSLNLQQDEKNLIEMRIVLGVRFLVFILGNLFRLLFLDDTLNSFVPIIYMVYSIVVTLLIIFVDTKILTKYKDSL